MITGVKLPALIFTTLDGPLGITMLFNHTQKVTYIVMHLAMYVVCLRACM